MPLFLQALLLLPLVGMVVYYEATENLDSFLSLPWMGAQVAAIRVAVWSKRYCGARRDCFW